MNKQDNPLINALFQNIFEFTLPWYAAFMSIPTFLTLALARALTRAEIRRMRAGNPPSPSIEAMKQLHGELETILRLPIRSPMCPGSIEKTYAVLNKAMELMHAHRRKLKK